ncbi:MAG: CapA family protein [Pseudomonadales bacterium]
MIFCGDTLLPNVYDESFLSKDDSGFWLKPKVVNFETSIHTAPLQKLTKGIALESDPTAIAFLNGLMVKCVSLSNNHFFDYPVDVDRQKSLFSDAGIASIGAGSNTAEAAAPYYNQDEDMLVVSFGWNVIRCKYATPNSEGVNPYEYSWVEGQIKKYRQEFPTATLVAFFHWNYEFEQYPQPADREFAHHLIDLGVDAIIGHHAHIIQGFEYYKGKPIFYGLGNCYFPNANYAGFELSFPASTKQGLSVEIGRSKCKAYVTELKSNSQLEVVTEGEPGTLDVLSTVSSFQGFSSGQYLEFFKANRVKTKLLPIYRSYRHKIRNKIFDKFVIYRQLPVDLLSKIRGRR